MTFNTHARKVYKADLPFKIRRSAFRSCLVRTQWLDQSFHTAYSYYSNRFGFDEDVPDAGARLIQAMNALSKERNISLEQVRLFDKKRVKEKMRGRRSPSKAAVEALYEKARYKPNRWDARKDEE